MIPPIAMIGALAIIPQDDHRHHLDLGNIIGGPGNQRRGADLSNSRNEKLETLAKILSRKI